MTTWTIDKKTKTTSAIILGGVLTIRRRDDTGKLAGEWVRSYPKPPSGELKPITVTVPLHDCVSLESAQARGEVVLRESFAKTHPDLNAEAVAEEAKLTAEIEVEAAKNDPF
jgi:hypothetical protein